MKIPMSWLKEYVNIPCDTKEFADKITMTGTKVEAIEQQGYNITNVVVGKILSVEKHPNADKLSLTKVDIGQKILQIITGATNIFAGAVVPVALDGATLAEGLKIKTGKIRGEVSEGMLCNIEELGYTRQDYPEAPENGIYIFQKEQTPGTDACELLEIRDEVVEYELTANRSDCFSVWGIARETAATFGADFLCPKLSLKEGAVGNIDELVKVEIEDPGLCPRYIARVVKDVKIQPSPQWLRHRLTASGVRPINNIVDITNYVMLETGQPMHAFDIENVSGGHIIVRKAKDGEMFTTLDGAERVLDSSMLVIADPKKAVALAGIMGGEHSKVTEGASAILFESANFNGVNVRQTGKKLGMRTDASTRFEKGLDPNLALTAVNRAMQLVEMLQCGQVLEGLQDCYPQKREPKTIKYNPQRVNDLLGTELSSQEMVEYLKRLEIHSTGTEAHIPTFRPDMEGEADIAEEVARMFGYDRIEPTLASGTPTVGKKSFSQQIEDIIKNTMTGLGFNESMAYSFESPKVFDKLNIPEESPLRQTIKIVNPLGEDFSIMRTITLNGMLQSLSTNYNRRNSFALLFELGKVYKPVQGGKPLETPTLTMGAYGGYVDFYVIKGVVEGLCQQLGITIKSLPEKEFTCMHPGRCAKLYVGDKELGFVGEMHPAVTEEYEIGREVYCAVLDVSIINEHANLVRQYKPLPKFPGIMRDIAILVKEDVLTIDIDAAIRERGGKHLESIVLFDVYSGKQIQEGYKSVAYNLVFRAGDRTLKDEEATSYIEKILRNLELKYGAQLRE